MGTQWKAHLNTIFLISILSWLRHPIKRHEGTVPEYGFESAAFEITSFKLRPCDTDAWNIVVLGQEACLDYLFEGKLDITQKDILSDPLHSKHPAVKAFQNLM